MLRPEQMSKVSVTGSKGVMDDVVETVHDCNLLHVTEYDGSWDGFQPGNPIDGAETASEKLVTVRSIESILDVDAEDAGPTRIVTDEALEEELGEIRERVNELEDRRDEIRTELGDVEEQIAAVEPFATLGIDLDLLSGYDTLDVIVGEGKREAVERAVVDADGIDAVGIFSEDDIVAVFARPAETADDDVLTDALVGVDFTALEVPDAEGAPEEYVTELEHRQQQLENKRRTVENELEEVKLDAAGFLLAAEEKLSIDVQKREAPLSFATTDNAFVAEGWIPTEEYTDFAAAITDAVGDHAEVEELERAAFKSDGSEVHEDVSAGSAEGTAATDGGDEIRADGGGNVVMRDDSPPVIPNNPGVVKPFEILTQAVSRPKYDEFDPTVVLFLTFPAFFGFMIGDLGYGALYTLIGYYLYSNFEGDAFKSMGGVTIFAGLFTMLFGILYGEFFGLHLIATYFWEGALGLSHPPMEKGLSPAGQSYALTWLVVSILVGILHLNVGYVFDFVENLELHDAKHALFESGSWILMLNGLWIAILSPDLVGATPDFVFTIFDGTGAAPEGAEAIHATYALGFNGFPQIVGLLALGAFFLGLILLVVGEPVEAIEFLNVLVNALSYTRIAAVLLAKAGMAFTVNLLFFGVYVTGEGPEAAFHFGLGHMPEVGSMYHGHEVTEIMFGGLVHSGPAMLIVGLLVLVLGHALVLALGVTSAGLQAVRLEYVEFFGKFYGGGGREYEPFGYERRYTTED
ncbi:V-type ATP synthase subunit I [Haloplanus rubicundus]|uniref:A-type ATP synthase subunit I n=1 Tax=Haloplanus rubicundus TaxID=1547898 RepID=A0A345EAC8_9EURY|nr:V-type ATP synthase subunit I [Haloplanus rubicundus]AXG09150.1 V-type ATP synthase subunit I [Haloplanus rubicundus]